MVKGELRCLGSTQHLKNKYGGGYMLEVKMKNVGQSSTFNNPNWDALEQQIQEQFPKAELSESFADRRTYSIPQSSVSSLAVAFKALENCK